MPRPIFQKQSQWVDQEIQAETKQPSFGLSGIDLEKRLRQRRSTDFSNRLQQLDTGEKIVSQAKTDQIMDAIKQEFPDIPDASKLLGIVAACYLGDPYEVHILDVESERIQHYPASEPLPPFLEPARSIALHPSYAYIEVYHECMCAIDKEGHVSVIK